MKSRIQLSGQSQTGAALLEAMLAILIFSLGVLTVIGIQAASIHMVTDAQYRSRASLLADRLIGEMWASGHSIDDLATHFGAGGSRYQNWLSDVQDPVKGGLPGVVGPVEEEEESDSGTLPVVTITGTDRDKRTVSITLFWQGRQGQKRRHTVTSQISRNL
jgi:type IV pilus assembly protein PilV